MRLSNVFYKDRTQKRCGLTFCLHTPVQTYDGNQKTPVPVMQSVLPACTYHDFGVSGIGWRSTQRVAKLTSTPSARTLGQEARAKVGHSWRC